MGRFRELVAGSLLVCLLAGCAGAGASPAPTSGTSPSRLILAPSLDPAVAATIANYQAEIPRLMAQEGVPGLALAVVDGDHPIWEQAFGSTDRDQARPVTLDTIFSVQSMSKLFTATAVLRAVEAGKLNLDDPITTYLPDFTIHSAFEAHPERKITLRMLLSHTAGLTMEAPVGNNDALDPGTFDAHVRSIEETWLRFPVGTGYAYSNLGIDLAGYILEQVSGKPFAQVMADSVLGPLGMDHSTFDRARIRATADRAIGQDLPLPSLPLDVPMTAAGGLYTSASDLARFLSFELGDGTLGGTTLLSPALIAEQRTVPAPNSGALWGYGLGVARTTWQLQNNPDLFSHGGGGFGFVSDLYFVPQLGLGIAILTNSDSFTSQGDLARSILRDLALSSVYQARMQAVPYRTPAIEGDSQYGPPANLATAIAAAAMPADSGQAARWAQCAGTYRIATWGVVSPTDPPDRFLVAGGVPYFDVVENGTLERHRLSEVEPSLFLADNGETLDCRGPQRTWRNLALIPVSGGPLPWQWALLGLVALAALAWLVGGLVGLLRQRRRRQLPRRRRWAVLLPLLATLTALVGLATIALLAAIPGLVEAGFLGWLVLPLPERLLIHLPLAVTLLTGCLVALGVVAWIRRWVPGSQVRYATLTVASCVLVGQLAAWHLIGLGF